MKARTVFLAVVTALVWTASATHAQLAWYDSHGFEAPVFSPGVLNGQDGWLSEGGGPSGDTARVVVSPEPTVGGQAVRLELGDSQGDYSLMARPIDDPLAAGWPIVIVSFDIYRIGPTQKQNLWWYWFDSGEPTYGLQWDLSKSTWCLSLPASSRWRAGCSPWRAFADADDKGDDGAGETLPPLSVVAKSESSILTCESFAGEV